MPKLERSQWYDLCRDMNWQFKYVTGAEVFPDRAVQLAVQQNDRR
jgi:toluene monooxygenase system protein A